MANRVQIGSIWMDGILKRPCFRFEPEDHFPFDPVANIEFRDSTGGPDDIIWIVANNKLIADRPVMHSASFADLQELNLGHGQEVVLDGQRYRIRTLMDLEEWTSALDEIGEDDHIWHWEQRQSFLQQPSGEESKVICTDLGNPYHAVTAVRTDRRYQTAWRPVLELARKPDFRQLEIGRSCSAGRAESGERHPAGGWDLRPDSSAAGWHRYLSQGCDNICKPGHGRQGHREQIGRGRGQTKGEIEWEPV